MDALHRNGLGDVLARSAIGRREGRQLPSRFSKALLCTLALASCGFSNASSETIQPAQRSYDPCLDPDEIADQYALENQRDAEIAWRTYIVNRTDADVADWYNLVAALRDADYPVEPMLRAVAAQCQPCDDVLVYTLALLAEECPAEAEALSAHADYILRR